MNIAIIITNRMSFFFFHSINNAYIYSYHYANTRGYKIINWKRSSLEEKKKELKITSSNTSV